LPPAARAAYDAGGVLGNPKHGPAVLANQKSTIKNRKFPHALPRM
jgi:hypothetical protein